jgi:hypothetical protein
MNRTFVLRSETHTQAVVAFIQSNALAMAAAGTPLAVTVTLAKSKRSLEQNARLHALLTDIAANAWVEGRQYDLETWKEFFRRKFIGIEEYHFPDGTGSERGISTTTLNVEDFGKFMDQITEYAQDHLAVEFSA